MIENYLNLHRPDRIGYDIEKKHIGEFHAGVDESIDNQFLVPSITFEYEGDRDDEIIAIDDKTAFLALFYILEGVPYDKMILPAIRNNVSEASEGLKRLIDAKTDRDKKAALQEINSDINENMSMGGYSFPFL